jgi:hypothetical protein
MSKPFPGLRYHGNKKAGIRHTKRGLLELFKTEELNKFLEVPILKRTVQVNEYTSITVHISAEQTFIHITSNPPVLPEPVPIPTPEEEPEHFGCPSAFIIRSIHSDVSPEDYQEGYVIGYNHMAEKWQVVTFRGPGGETVPYAANLGWFHLPNSSETYSKCDVVTWHGQASPDFAPPVNNGRYIQGILDYPKKTFLQPKIYFQGFELDAPNYVVGACILEAKDDDGVTHDYMFAHCVGLNTNTEHSPSYSDNYACYDVFYRIPLAEIMADPGASWEWTGTTLASAFSAVVDFWGTPDWFHPRSAAYIDKDGFSYVVRECRGATPESIASSIDGYTAFIKFNVRDGAGEVLSSSGMSEPSHLVDYLFEYSHIGYVPHSTPQYFQGGYSETNYGRPWIFYVFPGTQNLYTLALEHSYVATTHEDRDAYSVYPEEPGWSLWNSTAKGGTDLVMYKDHEEIERIKMCTVDIAHDWFKEKWVDPEWNYYHAHEMSRWIYEYHPEIPNSMNFVHSTLDYDFEELSSTIVNWHHDGEVSVLFSDIRSPVIEGNPDLTALRQAYLGNFALRDVYEGTVSTHVKQFTQSVTFDATPMNSDGEVMTWSTEDNLPLSGIALPPSYGPIYGFGNRENHYWTRIWGGANNFIVKNIADGDNRGPFWMANAYAVHRPVNGVKPYLWLRKKLYPSTSYGPYAFAPGQPWNGNLLEIGEARIHRSEEGPINGELDIQSGGYGNNYTNVALWSKPIGSFYDPDEDPGKENIPHWNDDEWILDSNVLEAETLNAMTKESGNAFFTIGIM